MIITMKFNLEKEIDPLMYICDTGSLSINLPWLNILLYIRIVSLGDKDFLFYCVFFSSFMSTYWGIRNLILGGRQQVILGWSWSDTKMYWAGETSLWPWISSTFEPHACRSFSTWNRLRHTWEEETSAEEFVLSYLPVGKSVGPFYWLFLPWFGLDFSHW